MTGISGEAFGLLYNMQAILASGRFGNQPLDDCFALLGLRYRVLEPNEDILPWLDADCPILLLNKTSTRIVLGYDDGGKSIHLFTGITGIAVQNHLEKVGYQPVNTKSEYCRIAVEGVTEPADPMPIYRRALERGYAMLTETGKIRGKFGYGQQMYNKWTAMLLDGKERQKQTKPMKFNLAERRCWGARFFRMAQEQCGFDLSSAADAFMQIHNKMWEVDRLTNGEYSGMVLTMEMHRRIADILKECRELDLKTAECIGSTLKI